MCRREHSSHCSSFGPTGGDTDPEVLSLNLTAGLLHGGLAHQFGCFLGSLWADILHEEDDHGYATAARDPSSWATGIWGVIPTEASDFGGWMSSQACVDLEGWMDLRPRRMPWCTRWWLCTSSSACLQWMLGRDVLGSVGRMWRLLWTVMAMGRLDWTDW